MMYIKQIVGMIMAVVFFGSVGFAQVDLCSVTKRDQLARTDKDTYKILYNITDTLLVSYINKNYGNFDLNKTISGEPNWYDNEGGKCNNLGLFPLGGYNLEKSNWNEFWQKYGSIASITPTIFPISMPILSRMQTYIRDYCGFDMGIDGKLGKKTINAINICKPPAQGRLAWSTLEQNIDKFYADENGTKLYDNGVFAGTPSEQIFVKKSDLPSGIAITDIDNNPGLGLVKEDACAEKFGTGYDAIKNEVKVENGQCVHIKPADEAKPPFIPGAKTDVTVTHEPTGEKLSVATNQGGQCRFTPPSTIVTDFEAAKTAYTDKNKTTLLTGNTVCEKGCPTNSKEVKLFASGSYVSVCEQCDPKLCNCGVKLNTYVPFIGRCIQNQETNNTGTGPDGTTVNSLNAFPILMGALMKILLSVVLVGCFATLIVGGVMMTVPDQYDTGKGLVKKVVWTIAGLGVLGTILYLINPNFFV